MAKTAQKTPKNIQINESVMFSYWNQNEWEFTIDPRNISKEAANHYQALAMMLTMRFCNRPIPVSRLTSFVGMTKQIFAQ